MRRTVKPDYSCASGGNRMRPGQGTEGQTGVLSLFAERWEY